MPTIIIPLFIRCALEARKVWFQEYSEGSVSDFAASVLIIYCGKALQRLLSFLSY